MSKSRFNAPKAPAPTDEQRRCERFYQRRLRANGVTVGMGRDKNGRYLSAFMRDAWDAWQAAQSSDPIAESREDVRFIANVSIEYAGDER